MDCSIDSESLIARIQVQQSEIEGLRAQLAAQTVPVGSPAERLSKQKWPLRADEYRRYGRQMIMPEVGLQGQLHLRNASVLIVGMGGLGCPAAAYLAGAGVGVLGLMDGDVVDISNLHRQILHSEGRVGMLKVESAETSLKLINPLVKYQLHREHLSSRSAVALFSQYDLILDCTDHPMSRYLISDASVCSGKPLISGAALRTDGQLCVLNYPPFQPNRDLSYQSGPCYRCVHPVPPPPEYLVNCNEGGVLGPVVGTIGVLMATETIKLLLSLTPRREGTDTVRDANLSPDPARGPSISPHTMLVYSAFGSPPFRTIKIRGRRLDCTACSADPSIRAIDAQKLVSGEIDYTAFCGRANSPNILSESARMEPRTFETFRAEAENEQVLLFDTRDETQFEICNIPGSINIPIEKVKSRASEIVDRVRKQQARSIIAVCRFGNDSQLAVQYLKENSNLQVEDVWIGDIKGGLEAWRRDIDPDFPEY